MLSFLPRKKAFGYSLLEISVAMLLFGMVLLMGGTTFLGITLEKKHLSAKRQAVSLAHNLMETLLGLPGEDARALNPSESDYWTASRHYEVDVTWEPYQNGLEKLVITYYEKNIPLITLSTLRD